MGFFSWLLLLLLPALLLIVAAVLMLVGLISVLIQAFKESTWWGLASLLIPFAIVVFAIKHWVRSKKGVKLFVLGLAIHLVAIIVLELGPSLPKDRRHQDLRNPLRILVLSFAISEGQKS